MAYISCNRLLYLGCICLIVLTGCNAGGQKEPIPTHFDITDVQCHDTSTPELQAYMDAILRNPNGDIYYMAYMKEILAVTRILANEGNARAMQLFGNFTYESNTIFLRESGNRSVKFFPDTLKGEIITALSYVYIAASIAGSHQDGANRRIESVEENSLTPPAWVNTAQENAKAWKAYCSVIP